MLARKNELFSNVSHEFRTPLTLILGPIKHLLREQADAGDLKQLNMVNRNANRLLSLVEQLLQIARVSDLNNIQTRPQKTKKQVQLLVESFQHMAQHKKIELQLQENDQATVNVTEQYIDTVLGNLLSNAIKYTSPGGKVLVRSKANKKGLVLSVKDSGAGLTEAQQQDIFKRFKRLESHQEIEGIGIGLSVVEEVVKINKGTIKVKSDLGVGSTFIVNVPLSDQIADNEDHSMSTLVKQFLTETEEVNNIQPGAVVEISDKKLNTILVIEDNHDMREHIVSIINPHYNCLTAINGLKGVAIAAEEVPDLIISDVMMPKKNGYQVCKTLKTDVRTSHIPVVLLTAKAAQEEKIEGLETGADDYLTKPFDAKELLIRVQNLIAIREQLRQRFAASINLKPSEVTTNSIDAEFLQNAMHIVETNMGSEDFNIEIFTQKIGMSRSTLNRKLKALTDLSISEFVNAIRLQKAIELLKKAL